jgi:hypothetical protein
MNKCKTCNKNCEKEYCFKHKIKKQLKQCSIKPALTFKKQVNDGHIPQMKEFFELCWKNKPHYSEVSGKFLGNTCSSLYQHHILAKSKYPEACFDEENIVFLTADEHASIELDMYKYEYVNEKRKKLLVKYERTK